jgi:hypothetical protein
VLHRLLQQKSLLMMNSPTSFSSVCLFNLINCETIKYYAIILKAAQMHSEGSSVELKRYRMLSQDATDPAEAFFGHEDTQAAASPRRHGINQPLLHSVGAISKAPIKRKPIQFGSSSSDFHGGGISTSTSQSDLKNGAAIIEPVVNEASTPNGEDTNGALVDKSDPSFAQGKWSGINVRQRGQSWILETCVYICMAVGAAMFLGESVRAERPKASILIVCQCLLFWQPASILPIQERTPSTPLVGPLC